MAAFGRMCGYLMPRLFASEHAYSYDSYTFGYALYAERVGGEPVDAIYRAGFLPYSGDHKAHVRDLYYMARSARVRLADFEPSSENRRVRRKFAEPFTVTEGPASDFLDNKVMIRFCLDYFAKRHGPDVMPEARLRRILGYAPETRVVSYAHADGTPAAYVIEIRGQRDAHYWFSFYDLSLAYASFGMWLILDRAIAAQAAGLEHYYVGTVYGDKALYKTNLPSLEFWNGEAWIDDTRLLKKRARADAQRVVPQMDEFKEHPRA